MSLAIAAAIWLPCLHLLYRQKQDHFRSDSGVSVKAQQLAARHLHLWSAGQSNEITRMRRSNAEWDFMGRSFLAWSLAEMALREPESKSVYVGVIDQIIEDTVRLEREKSFYFFSMPYAKSRPYVQQPARSQFVDSEIALMLAVRRLVESKSEYKPMLQERIVQIVERMKKSPSLSAESYPDECWMFDNVVALVAIKIADELDSKDHSELIRHWLSFAKQKLVHRETGLLVSSFTWDGTPLDGPEGSSIWMVTHCLRLLDEEFARDQFRRARRELGRELMGFGWSREWPVSWKGARDIDAGAVIPGLEISAGGSGMAFIAASSFADHQFLSSLHTTLDFAAFPKHEGGRLKYCASNQVGDAALLYAMVLGPIWEKAKQGIKP
jgi:hypothetical protein